jgi:hypothetical protein
MFEVRWSDVALNSLAALWTEARSELREQITRATDQTDTHLQSDPIAQSESRPDNRRIIFNFPLGVIFRIEPDGRPASVLQVWLFRRRTN